MKDKILLHCVFHKEKSPSMVLDKNSKSFDCLGCGKKGLIEDYDAVRQSLLNYLFANENVRVGIFKAKLAERCNDHYPLQIVLNSGIIIECMTDDIEFYDDHFQIYKDGGSCKATVIYPENIKSKFFPREIWVPYSSISFVTDAAS